MNHGTLAKVEVFFCENFRLWRLLISLVMEVATRQWTTTRRVCSQVLRVCDSEVQVQQDMLAAGRAV